ncbi:MAG TPA: DUF4250 domain-containing protein [Candidatus Dorea intestinavium]|nr:DUF4250 domain-containing protein [Candidatus Dorea intestinavium]
MNIELPTKDPVILLSVINTKLRDFYPSLTALCEDYHVDEETIKEKLRSIDYEYDKEINQFI